MLLFAVSENEAKHTQAPQHLNSLQKVEQQFQSPETTAPGGNVQIQVHIVLKHLFAGLPQIECISVP